MDPNQNPEDGEKTEDVAPLSMLPNPFNEPIPQEVRELKPIGIIDNQGNLVGLKFVNTDGGPQTHVTASSQICGGAIIYKGPEYDAVSVINSLSSSQHWYNAMAVDMRSAPMTLRFVSSINRDAKPIRRVDSKHGSDLVLILIPPGVPFFPSEYPDYPPLPINGPRPRLVMEGMLVGRSHAEASQICQFYFEELQ
ncbi:hypothetical protein FDENT_5198 [Fusarium denticulatum]|uniref:Uncharacterized protein n=1 Tax=Fusarium denticulatum TaxID=48507 RepID=A0A8H5UE90_9HYPO|nr:hypothetical protein FDENT_5198 [Fusarium denticulatum]